MGTTQLSEEEVVRQILLPRYPTCRRHRTLQRVADRNKFVPTLISCATATGDIS